jgi:prepilin-type N-terminal cleavage/methylation domain-containing protein
MIPMNTKSTCVKNQFFKWPQVSATGMVMKSINHKIGDNGFTLVELIVVCAILGVLALMALPALTDFKTKVRVSRCADEIRTIEKDIIAFAAENGHYPANLTEIKRNTLMDPWGHQFIYTPGGGYLDRDGVSLLNDDSFDLYSKGEDGITDGAGDLSSDPGPSMDDVVRGGNGSEVALGSDY